jgi:hypothetical protein
LLNNLSTQCRSARHSRGSGTGALKVTGRSTDGIAAKDGLVIDNATVTVSESVEAAHVLVVGGTVDVTSSDDGLNVAAGTSTSAETASDDAAAEATTEPEAAAWASSETSPEGGPPASGTAPQGEPPQGGDGMPGEAAGDFSLTVTGGEAPESTGVAAHP